MSTQARTVVAAVDMSALSTLALDEAIDVVSQNPASRLHTIQVLNELPRREKREAAARALQQHIQARLDAARARGIDFAGPVVAHVTTGGVALQIVQLASDLHADLIALGTHGRTGVERLFLGSVAEHVVRIAPCPVLVLREKNFSAGIPEIEPPCPLCLEARRQSAGQTLWCATHSETRERSHTYFNVRPDGEPHAPYSGGIAT